MLIKIKEHRKKKPSQKNPGEKIRTPETPCLFVSLHIYVSTDYCSIEHFLSHKTESLEVEQDPGLVG
jgi:hypothetical protein